MREAQMGDGAIEDSEDCECGLAASRIRPRPEGDLRYPMKLIATGAASCLDCHSPYDSQHVMRQFGWVSVFRKIAFALCSLKAAT
jgi:hypothetical protein